MKIRLLNLKNKIDLNFWNNFIEKHSIYFDVYYDHKYLDLYENENQSIVILFISEDESFWVNCFLKNKILNYDHLLKKNFYDIEIPYGYGGPITNSKNKSFIKNAEKFYVKWCQENDIICEFVRFHPLINNKIYCKYLDKIHFDRENRYMKLIMLRTIF